MRNLGDSVLAQPLLAFAFAYYLLIIIGAEIRKNNPAFKGALLTLDTDDFRQIKTNKYFRLISLGFISVIACFAMYPQVYKLLIPIAPLRNHAYDLAGIILLIFSMIKMVMTQMDTDQEMYQSNMRQQAVSHESLMYFSRRMMSGYFTMFMGFTLILANCATLLLFMISAILYTRELNAAGKEI
jgi:hypothetical protein